MSNEHTSSCKPYLVAVWHRGMWTLQVLQALVMSGLWQTCFLLVDQLAPQL